MTTVNQWFESRTCGASISLIVVSTVDEWEAAFELLMVDIIDFPFVGIDCEWLANDQVAEKALQAATEAESSSTLIDNIEQRRVCLLQLATRQGTCVLVRLCLFERLPDSLRRLLADERVWKVGVNTETDKRKLFGSWTVELESWVDLRNVFNDCVSVGHIVPRESTFGLGLNGLSERLFGHIACSNKSTIATSNWAAVTLSSEQTAYAAGDAQLGLDCFIAMCNAVWPEARGQLHIADISSRFEVHKCQPTSVKPHRLREKKTTDAAAAEKAARGDEQLNQRAKKIPQLRRNKLYDNIQLFAPDGTVVGLIGQKKATWYLTRGVAVETAPCVDPLTQSNPLLDVSQHDAKPTPSPSSSMPAALRLLRNPRGRPLGSEVYYIQAKENRCVVCGSHEHLVRKNIVPHEYRHFFPRERKSHHSHDVVLLCAVCHARAGAVDAKLRRLLADRFDAPLDTSRIAVDRQLYAVSKAAKALLNAPNRLPDDRKQLLQQMVRKHLAIDDATPLEEQHLRQAMAIGYRSENEAFSSHAKLVVDRICAQQAEGPHALEIMWRDHFLTNMKPQFLPPLWDRDHVKLDH